MLVSVVRPQNVERVVGRAIWLRIVLTGRRAALMDRVRETSRAAAWPGRPCSPASKPGGPASHNSSEYGARSEAG
jgi:hypothetical protein